MNVSKNPYLGREYILKPGLMQGMSIKQKLFI